MMAAGESLSPYDDITSDELFDSFMDVVSSVEQSFSEEDINSGSTICENPYEDISNINGMLSSDINIDICTKKNEQSQFSSLIPSNDPVHLPLLVKLCKEPIYELCGDSGHNGDINSPINSINSNTIISDLDEPDTLTDNDNGYNCSIYETLDDIITSSPQHNIVVNRNNEIVDSKHEMDNGFHTLCDKTSNLDDMSPENSYNEIPTVFPSYPAVSTETEPRGNITDEYATVNKENKSKAIVTDIYAVVNKENKSTEICRESPTHKTTVSNNVKHVPPDLSSPNNNNCTKQENMSLLHNSDNNPADISNSDTTVKNDYVEIIPVKCCDQDVLLENRNSSGSTENVVTENGNDYEVIGNIKPCLSNKESNSDLNSSSPNCPDIIFNAEQIAYGCNRYSKGNSEFYQSCIQTIEEKNELMSPQTPKASGKDKRNFFGFGKWKSTEDTSKSSIYPAQSLSADDLRKESRTLPSNCSSTNIPVLCSGYLFKQGGTGFIPKNWRLRWFHLKKDNCLYYYKSEQDQIPIGAVILLKYQVSRALNVNKRFAFKVSKGGARTYYFAANSEDEMKKWMGYLSDAVKDAVSDHTSIPECSLKNVSIPATSIADPDCHGFISKQGNIHKTWKKRYCVLKYGCLFYYEDITDKVAIGVFKLHRYAIHKSETTRNGFEAVPPVRKMRTYYFYTNTETDTRRWMDAMRRSITSFQ